MDQTAKKQEKLFAEFPPVSTDDWKAKIVKDLKGADYERKLVWKTEEGFDVQPFYRAEDLNDIESLDVFPGDFPFVRGNKNNNNHWLIRQDIKVQDYKSANKKALDILNKGITALGFDLQDKKPTETELEELLKNIVADCVELNFKTEGHAIEVVEIIENLAKKYNRNLNKIEASVDFDPLAHFLLYGKFRNGEKNDFDLAADLIRKANLLPAFRTLSVEGKVYKNAGASIVEELAFTLAQGNEYLSKLTEAGLSIDQIAPRMKFNFGIGANYFMEIAKFRAARLLWAQIVNAYGLERAETAKMYIHAETADWNKTIYDSYVNMLRTTTESMSASIAGVDSLLVQGFNNVYEEPTAFSERIARNQQLLLKEESYFDKIVDPSAGSYYIENLTQNIADQAWKLFLEIDEKGGFIEAAKQNLIQDQIRKSVQVKDLAIATRKKSILGTNQYPALNERLENELEPALLKACDLTLADAEIETLKPYRGAQAFERLRYQCDQYSLTNTRPLVFMLTYGNLTMRRARAQFASNFFAVAGYDVLDHNGYKSAQEGVEAAKSSKADIIVLCSGDEEYAELAPAVKDLMDEKTILVVAGYPKAIMDELKAKGIENFIHVKTNVLETLTKFQNELGIN
jgi:methylmalonyl-CoA mutase